MKKINLLILFLSMITLVNAQVKSSTSKEKKSVTIEKYTDKDGNEVIEKKVLEGDAVKKESDEKGGRSVKIYADSMGTVSYTHLDVYKRQAWTWAMAHTLWIGLVLAFIFYAFLHHFSSTNSKIKYRIGLGLLALLPVSSFIAFLSYLPSSENSTSVITYFSTNTAAFSTPEQLTVKPAFSSYIYKYSDSLFLLWVIGIGILSIRMPVSYTHLDVYKRQGLI